MTQPPFIPFAPADIEHLASVVAREWGGDRGVASNAGVDPKHIRVRVAEDGSIRGALVAHLTMAQSLGVTDRANSAIIALAEALEGLGYAVAWEPGPRVVGWAAVEEERIGVQGSPARRWLVRIVDLPPSDPRVRARDDALFAAREARRGAGPAADAKHVGAVRRNEAAYPRRAGR